MKPGNWKCDRYRFLVSGQSHQSGDRRESSLPSAIGRRREEVVADRRARLEAELLGGLDVLLGEVGPPLAVARHRAEDARLHVARCAADRALEVGEGGAGAAREEPDPPALAASGGVA